MGSCAQTHRCVFPVHAASSSQCLEVVSFTHQVLDFAAASTSHELVCEILGVYAGRDVVDELRRFSRRLVVATSPPQRSLLVATAPPIRILATCPAYETCYDLSVFTSAELLVRAA